MGKKNPFVFTIGFDKSDPDHVYVTELLNTTEKKAKLIVAAILAYTGRTDETGNGSISMEPDMLRPMMQQIIREEVRKVLEGQDVSKINREMPTEHPGWVFSHEEIYRNVWKEEPIDCANAVMCCISQLRKKLKVDSRNWNYIRTVRGVGYKFQPLSGE